MSKLLLIGEVADRLDRVSHTVRQWERDKRLPLELIPARDENGWRIWTEEQVNGLKNWIIEEDIRPGKGLETSKKPIIVKIETAGESNKA